jgi:hypothetical protein
MAQSKALPKKRYNRQRQNRAIRRTLASINPTNSHSQHQSLLFSKLPAELRLLIFQHVLSQTHNPDRPIDTHSHSPLYRPSHTHQTTISTPLLQTCRLIYHEAHSIPLRSATLHFRHLGSKGLIYHGDHWLRHMTKQRGLDFYHLHHKITNLTKREFEEFFLPHLKWKRVTWLICNHLWHHDDAGTDIPEVLGTVALPDSCNEVTIELEIQDGRPSDRSAWFREQVAKCRGLALVRSDGLELEFDNSLSLQYTWEGSDQWGTGNDSIDTGEKKSTDHHTMRLCWRNRQVSRREYLSYDRLDCLRLDGCLEVKKVTPLE